MQPRIEWGKYLRKYRIRLGLNQSEFADAVSRLLMECSPKCEEQLQKEGIEHLVISNCDLSRYETGKRTPRDRGRYLAFIWAFYKLGSIQSVEEANQWLLAAELAPLSAAQELAIFDGKHSFDEKDHQAEISASSQFTIALPTISLPTLSLPKMKWASRLINSIF